MQNPIQDRLAETGEATLLRPGGFMRIDLPKRELTPQQQEALGGENDLSFYLIGYIKFSEEKRPVRRLFFCRRYDHTQGRFVPVDSEDYEYED
jgi:hypothetical protein